MISHWFGWIALVITVGELLCFVARRIKNSKVLQRLRGKHHMAWGKAVLGLGILHGVLTCTLSVSGIVLWCMMLGLFLTYKFRKQLGKRWMPLHRVLAAGTIITGILHIMLRRF